MFGYVTADFGKLNEEDAVAYKAVYCALCESLKRHFGFTARAILNYDVTFLALVLLNNRKETCNIGKHYCPYRAKCSPIVEGENDIFLYCAAVLVILSYEKLLDNIRDEKAVKKLCFRLLAFLFRRKYQKASYYYPDLSDKIRHNMIHQEQLERQNASTDALAHPSADSLGLIFDKEGNNEILYRFGYCLGRWIYFTDAADDVQTDAKTGAFNPFHGGATAEKMHQILNHSMGEACETYETFDKGQFSVIIENILYEGSLLRQTHVLEGNRFESISGIRAFRGSRFGTN